MQPASLVGHILDDKYRIERQLGKGGMGAVYRATHIGTDRPVALKVIVPRLMGSDEFIERFRREAKATGRLRHPNVVDVTDFGFAPFGSERLAYLVMEYLDGCTLADVLSEESSLPIPWIADILEQTCSAVDEAHRLGIIHRDLKPDNIWLEPNRRGGYTVKVLDFGLAKIQEGFVQTLGTGEPGDGLAGDGQAVSSVGLTSLAPDDDGAPTLVQPGGGDATVPRHAWQTQSGAEDATMLVNARNPATIGAPLSARTTADAADEGKGLTRVGSIMGTPAYMSPEQCRGDRWINGATFIALG